MSCNFESCHVVSCTYLVVYLAIELGFHVAKGIRSKTARRTSILWVESSALGLVPARVDLKSPSVEMVELDLCLWRWRFCCQKGNQTDWFPMGKSRTFQVRMCFIFHVFARYRLSLKFSSDGFAVVYHYYRKLRLLLILIAQTPTHTIS